jgi:hypothetical protein
MIHKRITVHRGTTREPRTVPSHFAGHPESNHSQWQWQSSPIAKCHNPS